MLELLDRQRDALQRALDASNYVHGRQDRAAAASSNTPTDAESTACSIESSRALSWLPECLEESHTMGEVLGRLRTQVSMGFNHSREDFVKRVFDKHKSLEPSDASSGISKASLTCALNDVGILVSDSEAEELFYMQDMNRDGWIDWSEFLPMVMGRVGRVQQWVSLCVLWEILFFFFLCVRYCVL
jgi:hypothetical protein